MRMFKKRAELYNGIDDLPIYNWFKINETNDLKWICKGERENADAKELHFTWERIFDEFIDFFGIPEKMKEVLELRRNIFVLQAQLALTKDRTKLLFIEIEKDKLDKILKEENKKNASQVEVYMWKFLGFRLDQKTTSVKDFYKTLMAMNDANGKR